MVVAVLADDPNYYKYYLSKTDNRSRNIWTEIFW
jgi:hypothetical protein